MLLVNFVRPDSILGEAMTRFRLALHKPRRRANLYWHRKLKIHWLLVLSWDHSWGNVTRPSPLLLILRAQLMSLTKCLRYQCTLRCHFRWCNHYRVPVQTRPTFSERWSRHTYNSLLHLIMLSQRKRWTRDEESLIVKGVGEFGIGRWADIKVKFFPDSYRTPVDIKDKYRNMTKQPSNP